MSKGWKEVARLGGRGARYPQILVDAHGWCLRLGRHKRHDEKYYSSLPNLLVGLIEHAVRRRLMDSPVSLDLQSFVTKLKSSLDAARSLCREALEKGGQEEHIRPLDARTEPGRPQEPCLRLCDVQRGVDAELPTRLASTAG